MLIAIAIIGLISSASLIRTGFFDSNGGQELQRIMTFLRLQHAKTLRTASVRRIRFDPVNHTIVALSAPDETDGKLTLENWTIESSQTRTVDISPWYVNPRKIRLEGPNDAEQTLSTDWTMGFVKRDS